LIFLGRYGRLPTRLVFPAEACDVLKISLLVICYKMMSIVDISVVYHFVKTQSVIKLYIIFNMLEVGDKLMSTIGQDCIDALFWTATEPKKRKRESWGVVLHLFVACVYACELINIHVKKSSRRKIREEAFFVSRSTDVNIV
jgi:hypothetical protein